MRSPMTSRSNCAKDNRTLRVRRPIEGVVLNYCVTETKDAPRASRISTKITGITDAMVAGHHIDDRAVDDLSLGRYPQPSNLIAKDAASFLPNCGDRPHRAARLSPVLAVGTPEEELMRPNSRVGDD